jgi:carboxyl-terminal processing protease
MPRIVAPLVVFVFLSPFPLTEGGWGVRLSAAPGDKTPSKEALAAGDKFARELGVICPSISREYVRPIAVSELYHAAVIAIYDAARRPHPITLLRDLKAAKDEHAQFDLVKQARANLDGMHGLEDGRDLVIAVRSLTSVLDPHSILVPSGVLNGTATSNTYGFEFEGEAQIVRSAGRPARVPADAPEAFDASGVPPLPLRVLSVKPGGPAQQAGLRPGDIIRQIGGIAADSASAGKAFAALHSRKADAAIQLVVDRAGNKEAITLRLVRTEFQPESLFGVTRKGDNAWDFWLERDARIAYVRLGAIESDTGDRLQDILHDLGEIRGLVFDLRWCPGGYIDSATQIASTFLESGTIARMKYRNPQRGENVAIQADGGLVRYKAGDYPIVLLVNGETIGGGELIAAALKDNGRAVVAGTRTFGKATIQWPLALSALPGYSFKLTGGAYTRPNGKSLQRYPDSKPEDDWGLKPDSGYWIPTSADLARKLKEEHLLYTLRPGGSREALALDDPEADPQRVRALKLLKKLVEERVKKEQ